MLRLQILCNFFDMIILHHAQNFLMLIVCELSARKTSWVYDMIGILEIFTSRSTRDGRPI